MTKKKRQPPPRNNYWIAGYDWHIAEWLAAAKRCNVDPSWWTRRALNAAAEKLYQIHFTLDPTIKRGRPPKGTEAEQTYRHQFRASQDEIDAWGAAASAEGLELQEWARQALNAAASRVDQTYLFKVAG